MASLHRRRRRRRRTSPPLPCGASVWRDTRGGGGGGGRDGLFCHCSRGAAACFLESRSSCLALTRLHTTSPARPPTTRAANLYPASSAARLQLSSVSAGAHYCCAPLADSMCSRAPHGLGYSASSSSSSSPFFVSSFSRSASPLLRLPLRQRPASLSGHTWPSEARYSASTPIAGGGARQASSTSPRRLRVASAAKRAGAATAGNGEGELSPEDQEFWREHLALVNRCVFPSRVCSLPLLLSSPLSLLPLLSLSLIFVTFPFPFPAPGYVFN